MATVLLWISEAVFEEPADLSMKEAFRRAMGVAFAVGLSMMFDVRCCPLNWRSFNSHGAKDEQDSLHDRMRLEAAMGQHAMEADS